MLHQDKPMGFSLASLYVRIHSSTCWHFFFYIGSHAPVPPFPAHYLRGSMAYQRERSVPRLQAICCSDHSKFRAPGGWTIGRAI